MLHEMDETYLTGVWSAIVSRAKGFQECRHIEEKAKIAKEIVDKVLHLDAVAKKYNASIGICLKAEDHEHLELVCPKGHRTEVYVGQKIICKVCGWEPLIT